MRLRILDTSVLIQHWRARPSANASSARANARKLIDLRGSAHIVAPVEIEFLAGIKSEAEMLRAEAFLSQFKRPPNDEVRLEDWKKAREFARRVPRDGKPRQLADCLIRAMALRLKADVDTLDMRFSG